MVVTELFLGTRQTELDTGHSLELQWDAISQTDRAAPIAALLASMTQYEIDTSAEDAFVCSLDAQRASRAAIMQEFRTESVRKIQGEKTGRKL